MKSLIPFNLPKNIIVYKEPFFIFTLSNLIDSK